MTNQNKLEASFLNRNSWVENLSFLGSLASIFAFAVIAVILAFPLEMANIFIGPQLENSSITDVDLMNEMQARIAVLSFVFATGLGVFLFAIIINENQKKRLRSSILKLELAQQRMDLATGSFHNSLATIKDASARMKSVVVPYNNNADYLELVEDIFLSELDDRSRQIRAISSYSRVFSEHDFDDDRKQVLDIIGNYMLKSASSLRLLFSVGWIPSEWDEEKKNLLYNNILGEILTRVSVLKDGYDKGDHPPRIEVKFTGGSSHDRMIIPENRVFMHFRTHATLVAQRKGYMLESDDAYANNVDHFDELWADAISWDDVFSGYEKPDCGGFVIYR